MKNLILLSLCALLVACGTTKKKLDPWIGKPAKDFIQYAGYGPPDFVRSDGQQGAIMIYGREPNPITQIYVKPNGIIYYWRHWYQPNHFGSRRYVDMFWDETIPLNSVDTPVEIHSGAKP